MPSQNSAACSSWSTGGLTDAQFHEPATSSPRRPSLTSSNPPGASTTSAKALTIRSDKGRRVGAERPERIGKAQPLAAIIVAVLEEVLGDFDLQPAARSGARDHDHRADGHHREHARP